MRIAEKALGHRRFVASLGNWFSAGLRQNVRRVFFAFGSFVARSCRGPIVYCAFLSRGSRAVRMSRVARSCCVLRVHVASYRVLRVRVASVSRAYG